MDTFSALLHLFLNSIGTIAFVLIMLMFLGLIDFRGDNE